MTTSLKSRAEDQCVRNFWSSGPKFSIYQEFGVKAVLEELNTAIHAWACKAERGSFAVPIFGTTTFPVL